MRLLLVVCACVLESSVAFSARARAQLPLQRRRAAAAVAPRMISDAAMIQGGAAAAAGFAAGLGIVYFSENQIERGETRGSEAVSDVTKAKMSAMFMEDEEVPDTQLDDTVRRMEAAMAAANGEEVVPVVEAAKEEVKDDGW